MIHINKSMKQVYSILFFFDLSTVKTIAVGNTCYFLMLQMLISVCF